MALYAVTSSNWNSVAFWSGISQSTSGHTLDFSALASSFTVAYDTDTSSVTISDGVTSFVIGDSAYVGTPDATLGGSTIWHHFTTLIFGSGDHYVAAGYNGEIITTGAGDDTIFANAGADSVNAGDGNNVVYSGPDNDTVVTGTGADSLYGGDGADTLYAGDGTDFVDGGGGADIIYGQGGDDHLEGGWEDSASDTIEGGLGNDLIFGAGGNDVLLGQDGWDWIDGGYGADFIDGGTGNDRVVGDKDNDTIQGQAGADTLSGGAGSDTVLAGADADAIWGGVGDFIDGGETGTDNDTLNVSNAASVSYSGAESGTVFFNGGGSLTFQGIETVNVQTNNYIVEGTAGADQIGQFDFDADGDWVDNDDALGGGEADSIRAGAGDDTVWSNEGNDTIRGDDGNDLIYAGGENDVVYGGDGVVGNGDDVGGADTIYGGSGFDVIHGENGNDNLYGEAGADTIYGGDGDDSIDAGWGGSTPTFIDVANGGNADGTIGTDTFRWLAETASNATIRLDAGAGGDRTGDGVADHILVATTNDTNTLAVRAFDFGTDKIVLQENYVSISDSVISWGSNQHTYVATITYANGNTQTFNIEGEGTVPNPAEIFTTEWPFSGDDYVEGGAGADTIVTNDGDDTVFGGDGNDSIAGGAGADSLDGGVSWYDTVDYSGSAAAVNINLADALAETGGDAEGDTLSNFEMVLGSQGNDTITLDDTGMDVGANGGNDTVQGGDGDDRAWGGYGNDFLMGHGGNDLLEGQEGNDTLWAGIGDDTLTGGDGINYIYGQDGNDSLVGSAIGVGEFTEMHGGAGADTLDGTVGSWDIASYYNSTAGVNVNLNDALVETGGDAQGDTLIGIEQIDGSNLADDTISGGAGVTEIKGWGGNDSLVGGVSNNIMYGGDGADYLFGDSGDDTLDGDDGFATGGADTIMGGFGNDQIIGDVGNDLLDGGGGNDTIFAGDDADTIWGMTGNDQLYGENDADTFIIQNTFGNDTILGGEGVTTGADLDTIDLSAVTAPTTTTLTGAGAGSITDGTHTITFSEIERLVLSDAGDTVTGDLDTLGLFIDARDGDDSIRGGSAADTILGGAGADWINARNGTDSVQGGDGDDYIDGSGGADTLRGDAGNDSIEGSAGADSITGGAGDDLLVGYNALDMGTGSIVVDTDAGASDTIDGGDGADTIAGGQGADSLTGGADADRFVIHDAFGNDTIIGGEGVTGGVDFDVLDLSAVTTGVTVNWTNSEAGTVTSGANTITFSEIEQIVFTNLNDSINASAETAGLNFDAGGGDDSIRDGLGNDTIHGGVGNDRATIQSGGGDDLIVDVEAVYLAGDIGDDTVSMTSGRGYVGIDENWNLTFSDGQNASSSDGTYNLTLDGVYEFDAYGATNVLDASNAGEWIQYNTWSGDHTVTGSAFDDQMFYYSGGGTAYFDGGLGDDYLEGDSGADTLIGGGGNDQIVGDGGSASIGSGDHIDLGTGNDSVWAGAGADTIFGGTGADYIEGEYDADLIILEDNFGNDTIDGGDAFNTGTDFDTIDLSALTTGVTVVWTGSEAGTIASGADTITFSEIERVILSDQADVADASAVTVAALIEGAGGNDTLTGTGLDDTLRGGDGSDSLIGGAGSDTLEGGAGNDTLIAAVGDSVLGGDDADRITVDMLSGAGTVTVFGGEGGTDDDVLGFGLPGTSHALFTTYTGSESGTVTLGTTTVTFSEIEAIEFSWSNDVVDATPLATGIDVYTSGGNDFILGGAGDDTIRGGYHRDTVDGGTGNDWIDVGEGNDTVRFSDGYGQDTVLGGDFRNGVVGADVDVLDFASVTTNLTFSLTDGESGTATDGVNATTFSEFEQIVAGAGNDTLDGTGITGTIHFSSGGGADSATGGSGNDTLLGGAGADTLTGGAGADTLDGGTEDDDLILGSGDSVIGGSGDDEFYVYDAQGTGGSATIVGGEAGEDLIDGTNGGAGDWLRLERDSATTRVTDAYTIVATGNEAGTVTGADTDLVWSEIENIVTGDGADTVDLSLDTTGMAVYAEAGDDSVIGGSGDDHLEGGAGSDTIAGGAGSDFIDGGDGDDSLTTGDGTDTVIGGAGNDTIRNGAGDDSLVGGTGDDLIVASAGNDTLEGGDGNDTLDGGIDNDSMSGDADADTFVLNDGWGQDTIFGGETVTTGTDFDTIDLSAVTTGVTVTFTAAEAGTITDGINTVTFSEIETLQLGSGNDLLTGSTGADTAYMGVGNDSALGDSGNDTLWGELGDDTLDGGADNDLIFGGSGTDSILGGIGNDSLYGGADGDIIDGGDGDDLISGDEGDDTLSGGAGADTIAGGIGSDQITAGSGDSVTGGDGDDVFIATAADMNGAALTITGGEADETLGDTLNITGPAVINMTGAESGTVTWLDGSVLTFSEIETINYTACFTADTRIATARGSVRAIELRVGDRVLTRDNGYQPVRWIGMRALDAYALRADPRRSPVLIPAGSLGPATPEHDMLLSPRHRVLIDAPETELWFGEEEVLVAAQDLAVLDGVRRVIPREGVTYVHFLCDRHELVLSDGHWTESFQPGDLSLAGFDDAQREELFALFPELVTEEGRGDWDAARPALRSYQARVLFSRT